ncbi:hypothetical protein AAFF_G00380120 [Aldrovandia affinis]|uniref:Uncharacterized protein n=1 Tax=Aldrovandia affinis TaxID=143900 RepID=A0AAD7T833_9TELE|nr:hypothetical protein AAFF_G00380120 [Aldrovandia affinis]
MALGIPLLPSHPLMSRSSPWPAPAALDRNGVARLGCAKSVRQRRHPGAHLARHASQAILLAQGVICYVDKGERSSLVDDGLRGPWSQERARLPPEILPA